MSTPEQILSLLKKACAHADPIWRENTTPRCITLAAADWLASASVLQQDPTLYFDMLSCVTGLDNGPEAGTMEVIYNLYSIPFDLHLMIRIVLQRDKPELESVSALWKTADWQEREIFDLYGIHFFNHPDLRRILMPDDWEGHPLRKDYVHQDYYRDIQVKY